jgi:exosortase family protein XrtF
MLLTIDGNYTVNIVEGCNSISVIILFVAFIIAFAENLKKTVLFLFAGAVLIYIVNILRIAILTVALYKYPQHENILHSVVFPGIIYSMVFVLWMVWVRMLKPNSPNE